MTPRKAILGALVGLVAVGLVLPLGAAQAPRQPQLFLLHDVPDDGYTFVGNPVHFGYVLLTGERTTTVHRQGIIRIVQNNVTLYETTPDAGHDYNALNTFAIAFPVPGPYEVFAQVPGTVSYTATFKGTVFPATDVIRAFVELKAPASAQTGVPTEFEVAVKDTGGAVIPHSDVLFEIRRPADQWLLFRVHLHTHDEPMKLRFAFTEPGAHLVRAVGYMAYPGPGDPRFAAVVSTRTVEVVPGPTSALPQNPPSLPAAKGENRYTLLTTVDPQVSNTPFSRSVLSVLVYDSTTDTLVPHVDFSAVLTNAGGRVLFHSDTLHEYDGHFDVTVSRLVPERYSLIVSAEKGDWVGQARIDFVVAEVFPGAGGGTPLISSAGAVVVKARGLDALQSGSPQRIRLDAQSVAGTPAMHSEIDLQIVREPWGPPLLLNKVHTHASGTFEMDATFPEPGDYQLILDPLTVHGEPTPRYYFGEIGGRLVVPLKVAPGVPLPNVPALEVPAAPLEDEGAQIPGPGLFLALMGAVGAILLGRRTR